ENMMKIMETKSRGPTKLKYPGDVSYISSQDMIFSRMVYIYHENDLSLQERAKIESLFKLYNLTVLDRGPEYLVAKMVARSKK
ncbi:MAG: hypothetical protein ABSB79_13945, partial [Syntrophales bacterium]